MAEARHTVENAFIRHSSSTPESLLALISVLWLANSAAARSEGQNLKRSFGKGGS
jgi:hypothetical protein